MGIGRTIGLRPDLTPSEGDVRSNGIHSKEASAPVEIADAKAQTSSKKRAPKDVDAPLPEFDRRALTPQGGNSAAIRMLQQRGGDLNEATIREVLGAGAPFPARQAEALQAVAGRAITKAGLEAVYGGAIPEARVFVSDVSSRSPGTVEFAVTWVDADGEPVAQLKRRMGRGEDGDVELYSHGCWVDEDYRSRAVSVRVMEEEIGLLAALSDHPSTRLSLWAGGMSDPKNPEAFQPIGVYVWANMGFDAAQLYGARSKLPVGGAFRARCPEDEGELKKFNDFRLMKHKFSLWLERSVEAGSLPNDPPLLRGLREAAQAWESMWHVSAFAVDGLKVEVEFGGRAVACDVGKAFMLSGEAPRWEGTFFVNDHKSEAAQIALAYGTSKIQQADRERTATIDRVAAELGAPDLAVARAAVEEAGKLADPGFANRLRALAVARPELAPDVELALDRVEGRALAKGLAARVSSNELSLAERERAFDQYIELTPAEPTQWLLGLIRGPATGADYELARIAMRQLARGKNGDQPGDELIALYDRAIAQPKVPDGPGALRSKSARHLSQFDQLVKTREFVVSMLEKSKHPRASETLARIAANDPYWEVAGEAAQAFAVRERVDHPARVHDVVVGLLERSLARNQELKAQRPKQLEDDRAKTDRMISRLSRMREPLYGALVHVDDPRVAAALGRWQERELYWNPSTAALRALAEHAGESEPATVIAHARTLYRQALDARQYSPRSTVIKTLDRMGGPEAGRLLIELAALETDRWNLTDLAKALVNVRVPGAADARDSVVARYEALAAAEKARIEAARTR